MARASAARHVKFSGCTLAVLTLGLSPVARGQERPLPRRATETILPWTMPSSAWEIAGGISWRANAHPPFFTESPGTERDQWLLDLDASIGLGGGGEARLRFGGQHFEEEGGLEKTGIQDARLTFTYQLPVHGVSAAAALDVKLPNAPNDERLGTDETDVSLLGAAGRDAGAWGWACNLGLGIVGSPLEAGVQDDVLLLGGVGWWRLGARSSRADSLLLVMEAAGSAASRFGNDFRSARATLIVPIGRVRADFGLQRGLTSEAADWGVTAGVTFTSRPPGPKPR